MAGFEVLNVLSDIQHVKSQPLRYQLSAEGIERILVGATVRIDGVFASEDCVRQSCRMPSYVPT